MIRIDDSQVFHEYVFCIKIIGLGLLQKFILKFDSWFGMFSTVDFRTILKSKFTYKIISILKSYTKIIFFSGT